MFVCSHLLIVLRTIANGCVSSAAPLPDRERLMLLTIGGSEKKTEGKLD